MGRSRTIRLWRSAVLFAWLLCSAYGTAGAAEAIDPFPGFAASSYLVKMQGEVLWGRNAERVLSPASLTKIMTARLAVRLVKLDDVVVVGAGAAQETGTRLGLRSGEKLYAGFLLAATLLQSANDACRALADHVGGGEAKFAALMNREAKALGMRNTHFTNACGHDGPEHYSTAADLALLAEEAIKDPVISELAKTISLDISTQNNERTFHLENKNELVGRYPGAIGLKTGFTSRAGKCLVAVVERDGTRVVLVVLNAPNRWWGAVEVLDAAFARAGGAQAGR